MIWIDSVRDGSISRRLGCSVRYELFAILNHTGTAAGGHYYACIKSFETRKW